MSLVVLLFIIGFIGSFISGMVGIGGAIINYPMILYIPVLLGFTGYTAHEVSGITAVQVFFATLQGHGPIGKVMIWIKVSYVYGS